LVLPRSRSFLAASSAVFGALYFVLGLIPVSPYLTGPGYLPLNKIVAPLAGIVLGPLAGGLSIVVGSFANIAYTGQTRLAYLDFLPDLMVALTAWLAYSRRRTLAVLLPAALITAFYLDPLSLDFVSVGGVQVPFAWMHVLSVAVLALVLGLEGRGTLSRDGLLFIGGVVFGSVLCGQIAGTLVGQSVFVRVEGVFSPVAWDGRLLLVFWAYPLERLFYTVAGTILTVPVLRALSKKEAPLKVPA